MLENKIVTSSADEVKRLLNAGYAITAMSYFAGTEITYVLEKENKWSQALGSK